MFTLKSDLQKNHLVNKFFPQGDAWIPHWLFFRFIQDLGTSIAGTETSYHCERQFWNPEMIRLPHIVGQSSKSSTSLEVSCLGSWESSTSDFGLGTLFAHLETSRKFGDSLSSFRRNAEIVLGDSKVRIMFCYDGFYRVGLIYK